MKILNTYFTIFLMINLITLQTIVATCHIDDWTALKAFYKSTNGDQWKNRTGWDVHIASHSSPPDDCNLSDLSGVIIQGGSDRTELRVTTLQFSGNRLIGTIPPEIDKLTYLENFNLHVLIINRGDQLTGNIPKELGNLKNLQVLNLANNQLTGEIPPELGNLTNLNWFNLSFNQLSGTIPPELGNLNRLFDLNLTGNQLSGSIPAELGYSIFLKTLSLGRNQLTENIPKELSKLTNLDLLILSDNQLTGLIPTALGSLAQLRLLSLSNNQLSGTIPPELGNLTNLSDLHLANNQLSGCFPNILTVFCGPPASSSNEKISDGNQFEAEWENFCENKEGACSPNSINSHNLSDSIDFTYHQPSQTIHLVSSNLPIESVTLYNTHGQIFKNFNLKTTGDRRIDVADLANGLYVAVASVQGALFRANIVITK